MLTGWFIKEYCLCPKALKEGVFKLLTNYKLDIDIDKCAKAMI